MVVPNPDFHAQGDFGLEGGRLLDRAPRYTYANIGVLRAEFFAGRQPGRFALAPLMFEWIRQGRVSGELYRGRWHNLGTPMQLTQLDARAARAESGRQLIVSERGIFCVDMRERARVRRRVARDRLRSVAVLAFRCETLYLARRFCGLR